MSIKGCTNTNMNTNNAIILARTLMNNHGLGHWVFQFDRAKRRAGCCHHGRQIISLSYHYVENNNRTDVENTILHEIAHALVGPRNGHNNVWKAMALKIGARPERCYHNNIIMPKGRYEAKCNNCQRHFHFHRKLKNFHNRYCTKCGPKLGRLVWIRSESIEILDPESNPTLRTTTPLNSILTLLNGT